MATFWHRRHATNVALVHYDDLRADLEGEMRRLAARLDIAIGEDKWPGLVAEAGFDRMRERADKLAPQVTMDGLWPDASRFFNRGTSGQWRALLGPEDLDRYWARVRRLAPSRRAAWTHGGWRAVRGATIADPGTVRPTGVSESKGPAAAGWT